MITRFDKLQTELPHPKNPSPNSAAAVQELLGGKFGEMSTFMNYTYQSFNFRGRNEMRPFYDLIANIAAEEFGHIELVSYAINLLLTGTTERGDDPSETPLASAADARNTLPLPRQRPAGAADGLAGELLDRRERLLQRQPQARPAAQLLPRVRCAGLEDPGLRDGRRPDRARAAWASCWCAAASTSWRMPRRWRSSPVSMSASCCRSRTSATSGSPKRRSTRPGAPSDPLPVQPRGLPAGRRDLERRRIPEDGSELEVEVGAPEGFDPPELEAEPQLTAPVGPDIDPEMFLDVAGPVVP